LIAADENAGIIVFFSPFGCIGDYHQSPIRTNRQKNFLKYKEKKKEVFFSLKEKKKRKTCFFKERKKKEYFLSFVNLNQAKTLKRVLK
jgi:hypothetical protein